MGTRNTFRMIYLVLVYAKTFAMPGNLQVVEVCSGRKLSIVKVANVSLENQEVLAQKMLIAKPITTVFVTKVTRVIR